MTPSVPSDFAPQQSPMKSCTANRENCKYIGSCSDQAKVDEQSSAIMQSRLVDSASRQSPMRIVSHSMPNCCITSPENRKESAILNMQSDSRESSRAQAKADIDKTEAKETSRLLLRLKYNSATKSYSVEKANLNGESREIEEEAKSRVEKSNLIGESNEIQEEPKPRVETLRKSNTTCANSSHGKSSSMLDLNPFQPCSIKREATEKKSKNKDKKKHKFSVPLSHDEIEKDILAITESKPYFALRTVVLFISCRVSFPAFSYLLQ